MQSGEHTIKRPKSTAKPSRIIVLDWDFSVLSIRKWRVVNGEEKSVVNIETDDITSLFFHLKNLCANGDSWTIVGFRMYEMLCLAGMYDAIERKDIAITVVDETSEDVHKKGKARKYIGAMICQSPPTIIDAWLSNHAKVCFIDLA